MSPLGVELPRFCAPAFSEVDLTACHFILDFLTHSRISSNHHGLVTAVRRWMASICNGQQHDVYISTCVAADVDIRAVAISMG